MTTPTKFFGSSTRVTIRTLCLILGLVLVLWPVSVFAQEPKNQIIFTPEVPLPDFAGGPVSGETIAQYIRAVFVYFIWSVGLLAMFMIVYGGVKWVSAAGNPGRINDARATINNSIIGLIIALTSVLLLNTISPRLTNFKGITIQPVEQQLFIAELQAQAGSLTRCTKSHVGGEPSNVYSGHPPVDSTNPSSIVAFGSLNLNRLVYQSAQNTGFTGLDEFMIKAIVNIESPKVNGQPYSGPEGNTGPGGTPGPGYGVGQFQTGTLVEVLPQVNTPSGLPPGCRDQANARNGDRLSTGCKDWLDGRGSGFGGLGQSGLFTQVKMIAYYFGRQLVDETCIKGDPLLAAAAYNQGLGGAQDSFCSGKNFKDAATREVVKSRALEYMAKFKAAYIAACSNGTDEIPS